ncbi:CheR family methyltransferase [Tindallia californiensis]|uniref:protein-glutamate O-methyltransferase n=1 Tax=Tindallia californiensis TaxID=159292 RepID=A0A1H3I6Y7_9FIRM|nr:protein-glutamate O-methyltransferase CheR [Tindallia californiensis]SDY22694.1 MCP methyltransferase, CheR-type [Tindallia californiensis]
MTASLSSREFSLFQKYIEDQCGISIGDEKAYLIESRLTKLLIESKLNSFEELYKMLYDRKDPKLSEKVIDAITTNETLWFRDKTPWIILEKELMAEYISMIRNTGKRIKIWSAAASSGQEAYSTVISIDQYLKKHRVKDVGLKDFEIVGTDISAPVLEIAKMGRYDPISIMRGLDPKLKEEYFINEGRVWTVKDEIKKHVKFRKFNLQNSFHSLGKFDMIFCRYVMIYFSQDFKKEMTKKLANALQKKGVLFIGNSEIFPAYKEYFEAKHVDKGIYYQVKE